MLKGYMSKLLPSAEDIFNTNKTHQRIYLATENIHTNESYDTENEWKRNHQESETKYIYSDDAIRHDEE